MESKFSKLDVKISTLEQATVDLKLNVVARDVEISDLKSEVRAHREFAYLLEGVHKIRNRIPSAIATSPAKMTAAVCSRFSIEAYIITVLYSNCSLILPC